MGCVTWSCCQRRVLLDCAEGVAWRGPVEARSNRGRRPVAEALATRTRDPRRRDGVARAAASVRARRLGLRLRRGSTTRRLRLPCPGCRCRSSPSGTRTRDRPRDTARGRLPGSGNTPIATMEAPVRLRLIGWTFRTSPCSAASQRVRPVMSSRIRRASAAAVNGFCSRATPRRDRCSRTSALSA